MATPAASNSAVCSPGCRYGRRRAPLLRRSHGPAASSTLCRLGRRSGSRSAVKPGACRGGSSSWKSIPPLELAASELGVLTDELVLVGGATIAFGMARSDLFWCSTRCFSHDEARGGRQRSRRGSVLSQPARRSTRGADRSFGPVRRFDSIARRRARNSCSSGWCWALSGGSEELEAISEGMLVWLW